MTAQAFVGTIMIDCNDIEAMVTFWKEALGLEEKVRYPNYVWLGRVSEKGPALAFQQVPEAPGIELFHQRFFVLGGQDCLFPQPI